MNKQLGNRIDDIIHDHVEEAEREIISALVKDAHSEGLIESQAYLIQMLAAYGDSNGMPGIAKKFIKYLQKMSDLHKSDPYEHARVMLAEGFIVKRDLNGDVIEYRYPDNN